MDGGDIAIIGSGGTAALGFVVGVVTRYVQPRLASLQQRIDKIDKQLDRIDEKHDELLSLCKSGLLEQREVTGHKVTEVHAKLDKEIGAVRDEIAKMRETLGYLRGRTTQGGKNGC